MNVLLKEIILRILLGSIICLVCLLIVGRGAHREPVRLCCSAILVILIFSPYKRHSIDLTEIFDVKQNIEDELYSEIRKYEEQRNQNVIFDIENYIEQKAEEEGISCSIKLIYDYDQGSIKINGAKISDMKNEKDKETAYEILKNELGLERCEIIFD